MQNNLSSISQQPRNPCLEWDFNHLYSLFVDYIIELGNKRNKNSLIPWLIRWLELFEYGLFVAMQLVLNMISFAVSRASYSKEQSVVVMMETDRNGEQGCLALWVVEPISIQNWTWPN